MNNYKINAKLNFFTRISQIFTDLNHGILIITDVIFKDGK